MPATATIVEIDARTRDAVGSPLAVDFNPQTLRLTHTATGAPPTQGATTSTETTAVPRQATGYLTTLSMELLFDTSRDGSDVRQRTLVLVTLARPQTSANAVARTVRFAWGSFLFTGYLESLGETIDLFSADGVPLRATVALTMRGLAERDARPDGGGGAAGGGIGAGFGASAGIGASVGASAGFGASAGAGFGASAGAGASFGASAGAAVSAGGGVSAGAAAGAAVGTSPLTVAAAGDTVQSIAARAGLSWKAVAAANGIDNPRVLPPGTVLDLRLATH